MIEGQEGVSWDDWVELARACEEHGLEGLFRSDHYQSVFDLSGRGSLDAWATLAGLAAVTERIRLGTMVSPATFRRPSVLSRMVATVDHISGGRVELGLGGGWNQAEHDAHGFPFPALDERMEILEEQLEIVHRQWTEEEFSFQGRHYQLARTLNSPQSLRRPHPPILIGGGGERKTLRLVARYAQSCNLFAGPELAHKLDVLRRHCEAEGRDYDEIEKTVSYRMDVGSNGERVAQTIEELGALSELGVDVAHGQLAGMHEITPIEIVGSEVLPAAARL